MHQPGIEPGSVPWQGTILPLDHWCTDDWFATIYIIDIIVSSTKRPLQHRTHELVTCLQQKVNLFETLC
ncbi:hypothetical protein L6164_029675 [Bauhinia variegata]|uniref:Uncharacterized protein n=1 Tax=Bauhinia variegata TaxID=167791 RepID=A0ACB9L9K6_BAUVA|nr:hypothetical protein L6164_029675 [Bauhinia variegata]